MKTLFLFTLLLAGNAYADKNEAKANKIEELRLYHREIMEERLKSLESRHQKKIEFENEMYEAEKSHLIEIGKIESGIQTDNHAANQKLIKEIKSKINAFQVKMREKSEIFHQSNKKERENFLEKVKKRKK